MERGELGQGCRAAQGLNQASGPQRNRPRALRATARSLQEIPIETSSASFSFTAEDLKGLIARRNPPCVSIYLPTHRRKTEVHSDEILYRNLAKEAERMLSRDLPGPATREICDRLKSYDRPDFWDDGPRSDGMAVFVAAGLQTCYRLPGQFPELQVVGGSFHTKPLVRFLQSNSLSYHLLALNAHRVALYEGHGDSIHEVPLRGVPQAYEPPDPHGLLDVQHAARHKDAERVYYGQGSHKDHQKADLEKFFRLVAKELWKNHLRYSMKPLVLAAPGHHQPVFRKVSQIPLLLEEGIVADPAKLSADDLKAEARRVLEPEIQRRIARAIDEFGLAKSRGLGSDSLQDVARAVISGRVKTLIVESGRRIWGLLDPATGDVLPGDPARNAYDIDLLDELAEAALVRGGEVYVLKRDQMPTGHGVAAVYRF